MYWIFYIRTMNRRTVLATVAVGTTGGLTGCIAGGRVVHDEKRSVMIEAGKGWSFEITGVDGKGAVSYSVRANRQFDVYYFTSPEAYDRYQAFLSGEEPSKTPRGHSEFSRAAVQAEEGDHFEATVPEDGGRKSVTIENTHYFVVDHSSYGMGVPVEKGTDPLDAVVDLTVYKKTMPI